MRYNDHPAKQMCTLQQRFRPPGSRSFQLTAEESAPSGRHGYAIAADELDLDMGQPWPTIAPGTFDAAISLEVLEHMTHGPMHFCSTLHVRSGEVGTSSSPRPMGLGGRRSTVRCSGGTRCPTTTFDARLSVRGVTPQQGA